MAGLFGGQRQNNGIGSFLERVVLGSDVINDREKLALEREKLQRQQAAAASLNAFLSGGGQPQQAQASQSLDLDALAAGNLGPTETQMRAMQPQQPRGLPSLRAAAPALLAAQAQGIDIGDYVNLLDKTTPNVQVANGIAFDPQNTAPGTRIGVNLQDVRGVQVDTQDPTNANRFIPNIAEGQELLYDAQGRPVVRQIPGYAQGRAEVAGAIKGAESQAQTPFNVRTIQGPDGRPFTTSDANILGAGGIYGQSAADQAYAVESARDRAAREDTAESRASSAERMLPSLDRMEQLLPNVVAGFGSDPRLAANRVGAFFGNEDAQRRAASTEVFKNEARQIVSQIIRTFGANPTEGERKYAEQMSGADVDLTPQALQQGIDLAFARAARDMNATGRAIPVTSQSRYNALPSGTLFIAPDGTTRRKP